MGGWNRKRKEKRRRKKEEAARRAQLANQPVSIDSTKIDAPAMGSQGIMVQKQGTNEPIPVIYGKTRTGGAQVFIKAEGAYTPSGETEIPNAFLHMVMTLCEGEINNCTKIYFNDVLAATNNSSSGDSDSWAIQSPFDGYVTIKFRAGSDSQSAISDLSNGSIMGNDPKFTGIAYVYFKLKYYADIWKNGVPSITFEVEGKKVPSTSDGTSLSYSDNPANCILDYLTNTRYGKGIPVSQIDLPSFASAATHFNNEGFHCRGNLLTQVNMYDNMIDLFTCCNSSLTLGNKYKLVPEKTGSSVMTLDNYNTIGPLSYQLSSRAGLLNSIKVKFMDDSTDYKDNIKVIESSVLKTQDNVALLQSEIFLPFTKTVATAQRIATYKLNQSRQSNRIVLTASIEAMRLEPGDVVSLTNSTFNITNKLFRVTETIILPNNRIELSLREYDPNVYSLTILENAKNDDND